MTKCKNKMVFIGNEKIFFVVISKAVCADLKKIYSAVNLDDAEYAKEEFREKWDKKYPNILKSWDKDWAELTAFFEYPQEYAK